MADIYVKNKELGWKFQEIRTSLGMNQDDVSYKIGINKDTLSNYENGKTKIPAIICRELSKLYGVHIDYIWNDDDDDIAKELHNIIDLSNEKEVRYLYNIALGMQALRA